MSESDREEDDEYEAVQRLKRGRLRLYTLEELDRMRELVRVRELRLVRLQPYLFEADTVAEIELRLQSYLIAGIRPEELEEEKP